MSDEGHKKEPCRRSPSLRESLPNSATQHEVLHAAERVREAGYSKWDVYFAVSIAWNRRHHATSNGSSLVFRPGSRARIDHRAAVAMVDQCR